MKNGTKIAGIFSANLVLLGTIAKLMHWPLAGLIVLLGMVSVALWFIPVVTLEVKRKQRTLFPLVLIAAIAIVINLGSTVFVLSHWPYRNIAVLVSVFSTLILVLPVVVYYYAKTELISLKQFVIIIAVFLMLAVLDTFLSINHTKEFVQGSQVLNEQVHKLNKSYEVLVKNPSPSSVALRQVVKETVDNISKNRLTDSWPAEKVLWIDNDSYRIQELLKTYNKEVAKSGIAIPDDFNTSQRMNGQQVVPWREFYLGTQETFIILDRLSRIELYVNQSDYKIFLQECELAGV